MSTIQYPVGGIPVNYLVELSIDNAKCPTTPFTQPSGNLIEATTSVIQPHLCTTPINNPSNLGCSCTEIDQSIAGGYCYSLTTPSTGANGGSVMYYYDQTCTINGVTNYFCLYQFFDPATQNCGNVQSTTGIFLNSASTTGTCLQEGSVKQPIAAYLSLSSSPTSFWTKSKGITYATTIGGCKGSNVGYTWITSTCQTGGGPSDDSLSSQEYYCTTDGVKMDYYYGSTCDPKDLLEGYTISGIVTNGKYYNDVYKCGLNNDDDANSGGQSRLTIYTDSTAVNLCGTGAVTYNIGSLYSQVDCSSKQRILSTATIVCLTFFIPLIFYLMCWVIIVKVMKRGDLCIKAMCLQPKKDDGLAGQEIHQSRTDVENVNRLN